MLMRLILVASVLVFVVPMPANAEGDVTKGEMVFQRCTSCHSVTEEHNGKGPDLKGVVGRSIASAQGFDYSEAMKAFASEHPVWDELTLDLFLKGPMDVVKGTKMMMPPVRRDTERADVITFLKAH